MKKLITLILALILSIALIGCGAAEEAAPGGETKAETAATSEPAAEPAEEKTRDLPEGDYEEIGEGTAYLSTPSGTSENGEIPFFYVEEDLYLTHVGLNAYNFDGSLISYIYIDGILADKDQLSDTQTSVELKGDRIAEGLHTVEVVQYENNDPSGAMTLYRIMQYEIKTM